PFSKGKKWLWLCGAGSLTRRCGANLRSCRRMLITRSWKIQPDVPGALQALPRDSLHPGIVGIKCGVDHRVDTLAKAFLLKPHALRQRTKKLHVGAAFSQRRNRR